ncbi:MAG: rRNA ((1618)-N(6))-methyltransferase RlmF [Verrucomicrobiaceae bacterium]|nr:rRNA ((1618)-N(6))-methyltransferase RlmF [Verrucomicrobiaceae bacterium]
MTDNTDKSTEIPGTPALKEGLHPRNRFRERYDFDRLIKQSPALAAYVAPNRYGDDSIDYASPAAVKTLNQALLKHAYGLQGWDVPPGCLCPPVPGRGDYLHYLADLLAEANAGAIPRGRRVSVLDIGTGANCIYPLIGASEYGWRFVGSELDPGACRWAKKLAAASRSVACLIECRLQGDGRECFKGVVKPGEVFDLAMCNPPFHLSAREAAAATGRKRHNLGAGRPHEPAPVLNFGGKDGELWCEGGELAFVRRMIEQSAEQPGLCLWFTSLVSKSAHLPPLQKALRRAQAAEVRIIDMAQGQKKSRILAWSFQAPAERQAWRSRWA